MKRIFLSLIKLIFNNLGFEIKKIKKKKYTFLGKYSSYKDAYIASKNDTTYITKEFQKNFSMLGLENLETEGRFNIFTVFSAIVLNDKSVINFNCIEIGGGYNPIFLYILKTTNKKVSFQILEDKNFELKKGVPEEHKKFISYHKNLDQLNFENIYSVIFSGSIQFIENYDLILDEIFKNKIPYVFITETIFTNMQSNIVTLENNMENVTFPNIFFSFKKFNDLFLSKNYKLIYKTKRKTNKYTHNMIDQKDFFVRDLIYKLD